MSEFGSNTIRIVVCLMEIATKQWTEIDLSGLLSRESWNHWEAVSASFSRWYHIAIERFIVNFFKIKNQQLKAEG